MSRRGVTVEHLSRRYRVGPWWRRAVIEALQDVSFHVPPGTAWGVIGPNGSGKSTLLRLLATLVTPTSGTAAIDGEPLTRPRAVVGRLGFVASELTGLYGRLTGRENLLFYAGLHQLPDRVARRRIGALGAQLALTPVLDQWVETYSAGYRQRLVIARALMHDPPVLLMDEPTRGLDPWTTAAVRTWIAEELVRRQGKTLVIASNVPEDLTTTCARIMVLRQGRCETIVEGAHAPRALAALTREPAWAVR